MEIKVPSFATKQRHFVAKNKIVPGARWCGAPGPKRVRGISFINITKERDEFFLHQRPNGGEKVPGNTSLEYLWKLQHTLLLILSCSSLKNFDWWKMRWKSMQFPIILTPYVSCNIVEKYVLNYEKSVVLLLVSSLSK